MTQPHALTDVPSNLNFQSPLSFNFYIRRCPHVNFFITKCNVPGVSIEHPENPTPFVPIVQAGDHLAFAPLNITFKVDETFSNYLELHSWMRNVAKADDFLEYKALKKNQEHTGLGIRSEIILTVLNSARESTMQFTFHDCLPANLSDLNFNTELPSVDYIDASVQFIYTNFDYERVTGG